MNAMMRIKVIAGIAIFAIPVSYARAGDVLTIKIPRHSELTPVQRLNREGVEAVKKMQYEKAAALFYKAYLYDPSDPFTLNNLGYILELQGELDRAHKFYTLASEQGSNADIDMSNAKQLQGKPMLAAFQSLRDVPMRVNRMNVDAMDMLEQGRGFEAVALLHQALPLDPQNPFTLNNLGVADEAIGDYDYALKSYAAAADQHSKEPVVVTLDGQWRGKPVSAMAASSQRRLEDRLRKMGEAKQNAVQLSLRGVSAANQNNWQAARKDFLDAYAVDPASAFSLNNRGFVAEMDGDLETAEFFYEKARRAGDADARVGLATHNGAEGKKLLSVAADSDQQVTGEIDRYSQERRRQTGPIELTPRGDSSAPQTQPLPAPLPPAESPSSPQPQ